MSDVVAADDGGSPAATTPATIPETVAADFVAMWGELGNVRKSKTANAGTYSYSYADLGDLLDVARPILAKHGFALIQPLFRDGQPTVTILTQLIHRSGHVLVWPFDVQGSGTPQQTGSAVTYGRRYAGAAALGIAYEGDDDDGQAATKAAPATPPRQVPRERSPRDKLRAKTMALATQLGLGGDANRDRRLARMSDIAGRDVESWNDLDEDEALHLVDVWESELARAEFDAP